MPKIQFFETPADDLEPAIGFYNYSFASTIEKEETNSEGSENQYLF